MPSERSRKHSPRKSVRCVIQACRTAAAPWTICARPSRSSKSSSVPTARSDISTHVEEHGLVEGAERDAPDLVVSVRALPPDRVLLACLVHVAIARQRDQLHARGGRAGSRK